MTDDLVKEARLALWSAYCDKKMELEAANDRIEKLEAALRKIDRINDSPTCFNVEINDVVCAALAGEKKNG